MTPEEAEATIKKLRHWRGCLCDLCDQKRKQKKRRKSARSLDKGKVSDAT